MSSDFQTWADHVRCLSDALDGLLVEAGSIGVASPDGREWFELLRHKMLPQVTGSPWLVAAVVGGTNIGKSVTFNHLVGVRASGVSPIASKTKHPVCLVPPGFADSAALERIFGGFELQPWQSEQDPWDEGSEHHLYWKVGEQVPEKLLVLDTPDIDSDAPVNWQRADIVRQVSDVLIGVLTQQKYNDAAVKQFFRKAAEADKPVIIVFNQVDLVEDRPYWPQWLETFVRETHADVQLVYVVPYDRKSAGLLSLPFYEVGRDGKGEPREGGSLREALSSLHFDAIKIRTLRGALQRVVDPHEGLPRYVNDVRRVSGEFATALRTLASERLAQPNWPALPTSLLVNEVHQWWNERRSGWTRGVHGFYRILGDGVLWPVRKAWHAWRGEPIDPIEAFQRSERRAVVEAIQHVFDELGRLSDVGNEILQPRLKPLVSGEARAKFLALVTAEHEKLPALDEDFRQYLRARLDRFVVEYPGYRDALRWVDEAMAVLRPAITLTFSLGIPIEHAFHQVATQAASNTLTQVAMDTAVSGGVTVAGDTIATHGAGKGMELVASLMRDLQQGFVDQRRRWLEKLIHDHLLGDLRQVLERGAAVGQGRNLAEVTRLTGELRG